MKRDGERERGREGERERINQCLESNPERVIYE